MAKVYKGYGTGSVSDPKRVVVIIDGGEPQLLNQVGWSASGFNWGFPGYGPSALAKSILANHLSTENIPPQLVEDFMTKVVYRWDQGRGWTISSEELKGWLAARGVTSM